MSSLAVAVRRAVGRAVILLCVLAGYLVTQHVQPRAVTLRTVPSGRTEHAAERLQDEVQAITDRVRCEPVRPGRAPRTIPAAVIIYSGGALRVVPFHGITTAQLGAVVAWC